MSSSVDTALAESETPPDAHLLEVLRAQAQDSQEDTPLAVVDGQAMTQIPLDLYIPPDALEVFLESFEGPLDLLLYLIRKQNLNVLDINVFEMTRQYMAYVDLMSALQLELAAEYLVMAAMLAEIKSRMLLPRLAGDDEDDDEDPRAQLIRQLQEYEQFKEAAQTLRERPLVERDVFVGRAQKPSDISPKQAHPPVELDELLVAFRDVMARADMFDEHDVKRETLTTRERMVDVLSALQGYAFRPFESLFRVDEGRAGVLVTFLAILELSKESLIELVQTEAFAPIHVKAKAEAM